MSRVALLLLLVNVFSTALLDEGFEPTPCRHVKTCFSPLSNQHDKARLESLEVVWNIYRRWNWDPASGRQSRYIGQVVI